MLVALYLAAIVAANLALAAFGPAVAILNALVLVAFDLATRDRLHRAWEGRLLWLRMLALIAAGGVLSWALAATLTAAPADVVARIATWSPLAFVAAGAADALVFHLAARWSWMARANASNVAGAVVDSLVFGLGVGLPAGVIVAQIVVKVIGGVFWSSVLRPRVARLEEAPA